MRRFRHPRSQAGAGLSDPPRPLFPPRDNGPPASLGVPPLPSPPEPVNTAPGPAAAVERTVIEVFARRLQGQLMPYAQARLLVALEQEVILELTKLVSKAP
jgi:hypothetical protein